MSKAQMQALEYALIEWTWSNVSLLASADTAYKFLGMPVPLVFGDYITEIWRMWAAWTNLCWTFRYVNAYCETS